jgi:hypothetical protein
MLTADMNYGDRVKTGRRVESDIIAALRRQGLKLELPTPDEDKKQKIDAWIVDKHGVKHSLQIKYRESGDDILFEIIKDVEKNIVGRDWEGLAEYYFVLDRNNTGRLYLTAPIKAKATVVKRLVLEDLAVTPEKDSWEDYGWQAKIRPDRAHGQKKLMGYFSTRLFDAIAEWPRMI